MSCDPIVKWSGSKRSQAREIISRFPRSIDTYYEPFCGGCSVLYRLLQTPIIHVEKFVASDINADLISLWNEIKENCRRLCEDYARIWGTFNKHGFDIDDIERRKEVFYTVRDRLNEMHRPADFLFLMRTCTNGMPRYNNKGKFNSSCHFSRPGIEPLRLQKICLEWNHLLNARHVEFKCCSYTEIQPLKGDFVYCDSPYAGTKGMYFGTIDFNQYWSWLRNLSCRWAISFDGRTDKEDFTVSVPSDIYQVHEYLQSGNSSFRRIVGNDRHANVEESLYLNYSCCSGSSRTFQGVLF